MNKKYLSQIDANKIALIKSEGDTFDKILANLSFGDDYIRLTAKQTELFERWNHVFNMQCKGRSPEFIANVLKRNFGVSGISSVYRDMKMAERLFGEAGAINKNAKRLQALEWTRMSFKMALRQKDVTGMNAATRNLIIASGLDKEDPDTFLEEHIERHSYYAVIHTGTDSFQIDLSGSVVNKLPKKQADNIIQTIYRDIEDIEAVEIFGDGDKES